MKYFAIRWNPPQADKRGGCMGDPYTVFSASNEEQARKLCAEWAQTYKDSSVYYATSEQRYKTVPAIEKV